MPTPLKNLLRETRLFNQRILIMAIAIIVCSLLLLVRLGQLQIIQGQRYKTLSTQNEVSLIPIAPTRGLIYDRNGILLAKNIPVFSLTITPHKVKHLAKTIQELQQIIPISAENIHQFKRQLRQHRRFEPVPLRLKLNPTEVARFAVNQYRFPGVMVKASLIRQYPFGADLAHVLGYVGRINERDLLHLNASNYSATNFIGKVGLEKFYEPLLHGQVGYEQVETDASGRTVRTLKRIPPQPGANIYLTLDSKLESVAEKALNKHRGAIIALDPNNGEVLAMVSTPSYDPNLFVHGISNKAFHQLATSKEQPLYNRAIRGQYPLASTIKPFISLAALDSKTVTPSYKIYDPGTFKLPNSSHIYRDWKTSGHGWISITRAIIVSCDTYFYNLANLMGINHIASMLNQFGFGQATGLDMGEELTGLVPTPQWKMGYKGHPWYPGDTLISGIGQGYMLTTPIQLAQATAALATRGTRYKPHLLQKIAGSNQLDKIIKPQILPPVNIQHPWVWKTVLHAMQGVIKDHEGTGFRFGHHAKYSVAAKTGTAQIFSSHHAPHQDSNLPKNLRDHSLFIAFAPFNHPRIAIAVVVENSALAPNLARKVIDAYLKKSKPA